MIFTESTTEALTGTTPEVVTPGVTIGNISSSFFSFLQASGYIISMQHGKARLVMNTYQDAPPPPHNPIYILVAWGLVVIALEV